ncbi:hypothetical protein [Streptomyces xanthii]|uniref:Proline-rich protein n=1 Tax=Streptomyces xanthii TaxID=2768069 RepID=A0A7H1BL02_9ACTN|nr:hypothetical protein [Streptomyces xanthii]QNS09407.1 hypothetical protein IAG42_37205 [Streptomyces xanthii]
MNTTRAVTLAVAALTAALTLSGCGQLQDPASPPPPCPKPVHVAGGDLVPDGARPCLLSTSRPKTGSTRTPSADPNHRPQTDSPKTPGPARKTPTAPKVPAAPKSPSAPKPPAKAPEKVKVPDIKAPAAAPPRSRP